MMGHFIYPRTFIDIQFHDTLFVFGSEGRMGNVFFWYIDIALLVSVLFHNLLRRQALLSRGGQWVYAALSFILLVAVKVLVILWDQQSHRHITSINDIYKLDLLSTLFPLSIAIFLLQQLIFWVNSALLFLIKKRRLPMVE
jgi:hypothetical protein